MLFPFSFLTTTHCETYKTSNHEVSSVCMSIKFNCLQVLHGPKKWPGCFSTTWTTKLLRTFSRLRGCHTLSKWLCRESLSIILSTAMETCPVNPYSSNIQARIFISISLSSMACIIHKNYIPVPQH